jgi:hypothetical protein
LKSSRWRTTLWSRRSMVAAPKKVIVVPGRIVNVVV